MALTTFNGLSGTMTTATILSTSAHVLALMLPVLRGARLRTDLVSAMLVYFKMDLVGHTCNSKLLRSLRQEELKFKSLAELQSEFSVGLGNSVRSSLRIKGEKRTGEVAQH